jgi:3-isopropylmalate dehydrogenase
LTGQDVSAGWSARICNSRRSFHPPFRLGIIRGEGVGPEVIDAALNVLRALEGGTFSRFDVRMAGAADPNRAAGDGRLTSGLEDFCRDIFAGGGVILSGPREGRFVYDLRRCFDLFCKIVPLKVSNVLSAENRLKREHIEGVDILLLRENAAGLYQGDWRIEESSSGERKAIHSFAYSESEVRRIVEPAARIAASRKGKLTVIVKDGGLPAISQIWRDCGAAAARAANVQCSFVNIDLAAYLLIQNPRDLDVIVAPNLFGDILADLGAV